MERRGWSQESIVGANLQWRDELIHVEGKTRNNQYFGYELWVPRPGLLC